jgi:hypothetical protein
MTIVTKLVAEAEGTTGEAASIPIANAAAMIVARVLLETVISKR